MNYPPITPTKIYASSYKMAIVRRQFCSEPDHRDVASYQSEINSLPGNTPSPVTKKLVRNAPITARDEHDRALNWAMTEMLKDDTQLVKMPFDDPGFRKWLADQMYQTIAMAV